MTKLLLFGLLRQFSFVSAFLIPLIKFIVCLKFFHRQKAGGGHGRAGEDHTSLLHFTRSENESLSCPEKDYLVMLVLGLRNFLGEREG